MTKGEARSIRFLPLVFSTASLYVLSFAVMTVVVGIEQLEAGAPAAGWMRRHHASLVLVKQVLCMVAIPGFFLPVYRNLKAAFTQEPKPRFLAVAGGVAIGAVLCAIGLYALKRSIEAR